MLVRHEFQIEATCPVDGKPDLYDAVLETTCLVYVEDILAALIEVRSLKVPQERLTADLARKLGGTLTTVGYHSGVKTTVTAR